MAPIALSPMCVDKQAHRERLPLPFLCAAGCDAAAAGTFLVDRRLEPERRSSLAVAAT